MKAVLLMVLEKIHKVPDDPKVNRLTARSPRSKFTIYGRCILNMKAVSLMVLEKMHKVLDDPKMH